MTEKIQLSDIVWEYDFTPEPEEPPKVDITLYEKIKRTIRIASKWRIRRNKRVLAAKSSSPNVSRGEGLEHLRALKARK